MELSADEKKRATRDMRCCAIEAHELFLKEMCPLFGLKKSPDCLHIEFGRYHSDGFIKTKGGEIKIRVNRADSYAHDAFAFSKQVGSWGYWNEYLASREYIVAHESAHYLRRLGNPVASAVSRWEDFREVPGDEESFHFGRFLEEVIAEASAIDFMRRIDRLDRVSFWASSYNFFAPASRMLEEHGREAISDLSEMEVTQAIDFVRPYAFLAKQEPLISRKEAEGFFVHVEAA